jgi:hypothetical protein
LASSHPASMVAPLLTGSVSGSTKKLPIWLRNIQSLKMEIGFRVNSSRSGWKLKQQQQHNCWWLTHFCRWCSIFCKLNCNQRGISPAFQSWLAIFW